MQRLFSKFFLTFMSSLLVWTQCFAAGGDPVCLNILKPMSIEQREAQIDDALDGYLQSLDAKFARGSFRVFRSRLEKAIIKECGAAILCSRDQLDKAIQGELNTFSEKLAKASLRLNQLKGHIIIFSTVAAGVAVSAFLKIHGSSPMVTALSEIVSIFVALGVRDMLAPILIDPLKSK